MIPSTVSGLCRNQGSPLGVVPYKILVLLFGGKKYPREKLLPYSKVTENENILQIGKPGACYTVTTQGVFVKSKEKGVVVGIDVRRLSPKVS